MWVNVAMSQFSQTPATIGTSVFRQIVTRQLHHYTSYNL